MSPEPRRAPTPEFILACQRADVKETTISPHDPKNQKNSEKFRRISFKTLENAGRRGV